MNDSGASTTSGFLPSVSPLEEDILICLEVKSLFGAQIIEIIARAYNLASGSSIEDAPTSGSLYPTLRRLEKNKKCIASRWGDNEEEGPRRRYYKITALGLEALRNLRIRRQYLSEMGSELSPVSDLNSQFQ